MIKIMYICIVVAVIAGALGAFVVSRSPVQPNEVSAPEGVMCTMDARQCPDGTYVGRTGPRCEFVCPALPSVPAEVQAKIDAKSDLVRLTQPVPLGLVESGIQISGSARGSWYFEGSFPIVLKNAAGDVLSQGIATAQSNWMTTEFVPFTATLEFTSPVPEGIAADVELGTLILQKDNPSGLPENDDRLEIPVRFTR